MQFDFEKFEAVGASFAPKITVRSNGALGFSQGALNRFGLNEGEWFVFLYFDKKRQVVGIKPTRDGTAKGAIQLVKRVVKGVNNKTSMNSFVSAKAFMDYHAIDYRESRVFHGEWYKEGEADGLIIVRLSESGQEAAPPELEEPS